MWSCSESPEDVPLSLHTLSATPPSTPSDHSKQGGEPASRAVQKRELRLKPGRRRELPLSHCGSYWSLLERCGECNTRYLVSAKPLRQFRTRVSGRADANALPSVAMKNC